MISGSEGSATVRSGARAISAESPAQFLENHPFAEIRVGDEARIVHQVTSRDSPLFAAVSGDVSPAHVDAIYAKSTSFHQIIAHGMLGGSLISRVRALPC